MLTPGLDHDSGTGLGKNYLSALNKWFRKMTVNQSNSCQAFPLNLHRRAPAKHARVCVE